MRSFLESFFNLAPQRSRSIDARELLGKLDTELDLFKLMTAALATDQVLCHAPRLFFGQLAVTVRGKFLTDVLTKHLFTHSESAPRRCDRRRAKILWPRFRRDAIVPFEQLSTSA